MMCLNYLMLVCALAGVVFSQSAPINEVITKVDMDRFKALAEKVLSTADQQEMPTLFYASNVAKQVNHASSKTKFICDELKSVTETEVPLQFIYYIAGVNKALNCGVSYFTLIIPPALQGFRVFLLFKAKSIQKSKMYLLQNVLKFIFWAFEMIFERFLIHKTAYYIPAAFPILGMIFPSFLSKTYVVIF